MQSAPEVGNSKAGGEKQQEQKPAEPEVKSAIQSILDHWENKEYFK